jgi:ribosomal protein S18 acetylase RimI-like enzyme
MFADIRRDGKSAGRVRTDRMRDGTMRAGPSATTGDSTMISIRAATADDAAALWAVLAPVIRAGETYALPRDIGEAEALAYWRRPEHDTYVAVDDGAVVGTYVLRANQLGGGDHVANCGYVTAPWAQGKGVARRMLEHSLERAKARGFRAMQFNLVVASNVRAVGLWQRYGFEIVGRLPSAFRHPTLGFVDALVMYKTL